MIAGPTGLPRHAAARLRQLQTLHSLTDDVTDALARLLLVIATDPLAPTTVIDPDAAVDAHVADALVALDLPEVAAARRIADLGSGAGIPGLVLAIALPAASVALVESTARKCAFLQRAIDITGATYTAIVNERIESWRAGIGTQDVVTARALAPLNVVAEYAAPLLRVGGELIAWTGRRESAAELEAGRAADVLGLSQPEALRVEPFPHAEHRHLVRMRKLHPTPDAYPRRIGVARKRPLGAGEPLSDRPRR